MADKNNANDNTYGMLSDRDIRKYIGNGIEIFTSDDDKRFNLEEQLQPSSVDLRFRNSFKRIKYPENASISHENVDNNDYTELFELKNNEKLKIQPREIILTTTLETIKLSKNFGAFITGRSSIARLGVMVQCCQLFINPGSSQATALQLINLSPNTIELDLNIPVCQMILFKLSSTALKGYSETDEAEYLDETTPRESKYSEAVINNTKNSKQTDDEPKNTAAHNNSNSKLKKVLKKYLEPLLPTFLSFTVIAPFITAYLQEISVNDLFEKIKGLNISVVIAGIIIIIFIWLKKDGTQ